MQELCNATLDRIQEVGDKNRLETRIVEDLSIEKEECILQWGERNDVRTKLKIACKSSPLDYWSTLSFFSSIF